MKKKILLMIGIILTFIPFETKAANATGTITCDKTTLKENEEATCVIKGNYDGEVSAVHGEVTVGNYLSIVSVTRDSSWQGTDNDTQIDYYTDTNKTGGFNIAVVKVKATGIAAGYDSSISVNNLEFTTGSTFDEKSASIQPVSIRIPSTINELSDIKLDGVTISDFLSTKTAYDITVASSKTSTLLSFTKASNKSTTNIEGGSLTLNYGINTYTIEVTSEIGVKKTYTLNINRPDNRSKDNDLVSFEFYNYDINFDKDVVEYNLTVPYTISSIGSGKFDDEYNLENILMINLNKLTDIFNSTNKSYKIYFNDDELFVTSSFIYSNNGSNITTERNQEDTAFEIKDSGEVVGETTDNSSYIIISDLKEGNNILKIVVTAENETSKTYLFNINRLNIDGKDITNPNTGIINYVGIVLSLITVIGVVYLIIRKKTKFPKKA